MSTASYCILMDVFPYLPLFPSLFIKPTTPLIYLPWSFNPFHTPFSLINPLTGSSSPGPKSTSKTPKLFKRFHRHRRWQSSSGVKLEEEMIPPEEFLNPSLLDLKQQPLVGGAVVDRLYLLPAREVAEGLTQIDAELLGRISPDEIRDGAWMKRGQKVREVTK